jgi:seryl-tRNA synthetase
MKNEHRKILGDAIKSLAEQNSKFDSLVADSIGIIDRELETLGNLADDLQSMFDDMSEKQQEGEKGSELEEAINKVDEIKTDLEELKDELDDAPFDDLITKLEELDPASK